MVDRNGPRITDDVLVKAVFGRVNAGCARHFKCTRLAQSGTYEWPLNRLARNVRMPEYR